MWVSTINVGDLWGNKFFLGEGISERNICIITEIQNQSQHLKKNN